METICALAINVATERAALSDLARSIQRHSEKPGLQVEWTDEFRNGVEWRSIGRFDSNKSTYAHIMAVDGRGITASVQIEEWCPKWGRIAPKSTMKTELESFQAAKEWAMTEIARRIGA